MSDKEEGHSEEEEEQGEAASEEEHGENKDKERDDIRNVDVVTKYRQAGDIVNAALQEVSAKCVDGASIVELCKFGDERITEASSKLYTKNKKVRKGLGFPTCISVNNVVGSFSPLDKDDAKLKKGDLVKIECGCHIDGYLATGGHTIVVDEEKVAGRKADVLAALNTAVECAVRLIKPGTKSTTITDVLQLVASDFKCAMVEDVYSHRLNRYDMDYEHVIANNKPESPPKGDEKKEEVTLDAYQVWNMDIVISTGSGKPNVVDDRTTVYRRLPESVYQLKMKASRLVFSQISERFPVFPFTIRALDVDEAKLKLGTIECYRHKLLEAYPVVQEKPGEYVASAKFTVLVFPEKSIKVTGVSSDTSKFSSELKPVHPEVKKVLDMAKPSGAKKGKAKKKKKQQQPATNQQ